MSGWPRKEIPINSHISRSIHSADGQIGVIEAISGLSRSIRVRTVIDQPKSNREPSGRGFRFDVAHQRRTRSANGPARSSDRILVASGMTSDPPQNTHVSRRAETSPINRSPKADLIPVTAASRFFSAERFTSSLLPLQGFSAYRSLE